MKQIILPYFFLFVLITSCDDKFVLDTSSKIEKNSYVKFSDIKADDNEMLIEMKIVKKDTFNVSCFVFLGDSSIAVREINRKIIKTLSCEKEQPEFEGSSFGREIGNYFEFGEGKEMSGKVDVKTIDDLIDKVEIVDSILSTMPEFPDTNCFYHYSYKDLREVYYFRYGEKDWKLVDSLIDNCKLPIKFRRLDCNCHH